MNIIMNNNQHICTTTRIINIHIINRNLTITMSTSICLTPAIRWFHVQLPRLDVRNAAHSAFTTTTLL